MQPYQSYQPYNGYNQFQNGYNPTFQNQPRVPQTDLQYPQYYQQQLQSQLTLNGRMINSIEEVTANEVRMDGSISVFPKNDMSEIYLKSWNADGTIKTVAYKPVIEEVQNKEEQAASIIEIPDDFKDEILKHIDERFDKFEKSFSTKSQNSRSKKEDSE